MFCYVFLGQTLVVAVVDPVGLGAVLGATVGLGLLWRVLSTERFWTQRMLAGAILGLVLLGYWGVEPGTAVRLSDDTRLLWRAEAAPEATLRALSTALVGASLLILPGLFWLYRLFKTPSTGT